MEGEGSSLVVQDDNTRRFSGSAGRRQRCCWFVPFSLRWCGPALVVAKVALLVVTVLISADPDFQAALRSIAAPICGLYRLAAGGWLRGRVHLSREA